MRKACGAVSTGQVRVCWPLTVFEHGVHDGLRAHDVARWRKSLQDGFTACLRKVDVETTQDICLGCDDFAHWADAFQRRPNNVEAGIGRGALVATWLICPGWRGQIKLPGGFQADAPERTVRQYLPASGPVIEPGSIRSSACAAAKQPGQEPRGSLPCRIGGAAVLPR